MGSLKLFPSGMNFLCLNYHPIDCVLCISYSPFYMGRGSGFNQLLWINNKNMKRKFLRLLVSFQRWDRLRGKWCELEGVFQGGFCSVSVKISCLAHLSEKTKVLALTSDPCKAACIAARCSHAIRGKGGGACKSMRLALEFCGQIYNFFVLMCFPPLWTVNCVVYLN